MRVFKEFPKEFTCPICKTNDNKECVLVGKEGTQEGHNIEAQPFHLDCIQLTWLKGKDIICMLWESRS